MIPLLLACTSSTIVTDPPPETSETAVDSAPLDEVPVDTGEPPPPPPPPAAPGFATLDCAQSPPAEGKVDCALTITDDLGAVLWDGTAGVGLHGRSSMDFAKSQFSIELRDEAGDDAPTDLFGMGAEADWILNGMYIDRALFRNKLCFDLHRSLSADETRPSVYCPHEPLRGPAGRTGSPGGSRCGTCTRCPHRSAWATRRPVRSRRRV